MLRGIIISLLMGLSSFVMAQDPNTILFTKLKIIDGYTEQPLESACVSIIDKESGKVLVDSMMPSWNRGNVNGETKKIFGGYVARAPRRSSYVFRFRCAGYDSEDYEVAPGAGPDGKPLLKYVFKNTYYVWKKTINLPDVAVKASKILMVMKGDTIEYNAASFRMAEGSMLDDLIRALPGAKLDNNGRITVNGEFVKSLLVNGRDFFNGDPKVALANLPAYTVNKVKVYRKAPEYAELMGERSEAEKEKDPLVMDVGLKREYQEGWISNYEVGGGSGLDGNFDEKWLGRMFGMRYTNHSSIAVYANANNLSDAGMPSGKGEWKRTDATTGNRKTYMGGIDFSLDPKDTDIHFKTSLQAEHQDVDNQSRTMREDYYAEGNTYRNAISFYNPRMTNIRWNAKLEAKTGKTFLYVNPNVHYSRNKSEGLTETHVAEELDSLYSREQRSNSLETEWGTSLNAGGFTVIGNDFLNYSADFSYGKSKYESNVMDRIVYNSAETGNIYEQRKSNVPKSNYGYSLGMTYEKHFSGADTAFFKMNYWLGYKYTQRFNSGHQDLYRCDEDWLTPSASSAFVLDQANSYHTTRMERIHTANYYLNMYFGKVGVEFEGDVNVYNRGIDDLRNAEKRSKTKDNVTFNPSLSVSYNSKLGKMRLKGAINNNLPDIMDLLDVRDESDPLNHFTGNAELKTTRGYNMGFMYELKKKRFMRILRFNADYNIWENSIGMAQILDRASGVTTYKPMNIDGNRLASANVYYSQFLDKGSHWNISNTLGYSYRRSVDFSGESYVNDDNSIYLNKQEVDNSILNDEFRLDYRFESFSISALANVKWTRLSSRNENFNNFSYTDFNYGISLSTPLLWGIDLSTDIMAYNRRGYSYASMNTTDWVWNASLSRALGKSKQWVVKMIGFDLLRQLSNVKHIVNAQGRTETWYNTVPSYATLHVVYRLDIKPKKRR